MNAFLPNPSRSDLNIKDENDLLVEYMPSVLSECCKGMEQPPGVLRLNYQQRFAVCNLAGSACLVKVTQ